MAENLTPQNRQDDDELSVEELEEAAGGTGTMNQCPITNYSSCVSADSAQKGTAT